MTPSMSAIHPFKFILPLLLLGLASASPQDPADHDEPAPPIAINGAPVSWDEFASWLILIQGPSNVDEFVIERLLEAEAQRQGILGISEQLDEQINTNISRRIEGAFEGEREKWVDELLRLGLTPEIYHAEQLRSLRKALWTNALVPRHRLVTEADARELWEARHGPDGRTMNMSLLNLKIEAPPQPPGTSREENIRMNEAAKEAAFEEARLHLSQLRAGADFGELIREHSDDETTRDRGGSLKEPFSFTRWPGVSRLELAALKVGEYLEPFYNSGGICLLRLDSEEVTPFSEVSASLTEELQLARPDQKESQEYWHSLITDARIEVLPELNRIVSIESPRRDRPVMIIDGEPITRLEYTSWLVARRGRPLMRTFAQHMDVKRRASEAGISVTSIEVEQRVREDLDRQIAMFFDGDREAYLADLAANEVTLDEAMQLSRIRTENIMLAERLIVQERVVTLQDLEREWEDRYGEGGSSFDLRLILRQIPDPEEGALQTDEELREYLAAQSLQIQEFLSGLRERAENGEDFGALARLYSEDAESRDRGGRPAERILLYTLPESVQEELRGLSVGELSGVIEFGGGTFLLFELAGKIHVPLKDVIDELRVELQQRRPSQVQVISQVNSWTQDMLLSPLPGMYP